MNIHTLFTTCLEKIGGETNRHVRRYLHERPKIITRQSFYEEAAWAVWSSGLGYKSAKPFLDRAEEEGDFDWDFTTFAAMPLKDLCAFVQDIHGQKPSGLAFQKWQAIWTIAHWLDEYGTDKAFRADVFRGKVQSVDLDETDAKQLLERLKRLKKQHPRVPLWISLTNAQFIIRNMGGEAVKCDQWIQAFLDYTGLSLDQLHDQLRQSGIPLGYFDIVFYNYCRRFVREFDALGAYFDRVFPK